MRKRLTAALTAAALLITLTPAAEATPLQAPAIFATNNTAIITDPDDPRLKTRLTRFDRDVRKIVHLNGGLTTNSTLLDGVFWSTALNQTTFERSRRFDVRGLNTQGLHHTADTIRKQFDQESVLTFEYLHHNSPRVTAIHVEVPNVTAQQLRTGLTNDPVARERLGGGSVTLHDKLILIADKNDQQLVRDFVTRIGGQWNRAKVSRGAWDFVSAEANPLRDAA